MFGGGALETAGCAPRRKPLRQPNAANSSVNITSWPSQPARKAVNRRSIHRSTPICVSVVHETPEAFWALTGQGSDMAERLWAALGQSGQKREEHADYPPKS